MLRRIETVMQHKVHQLPSTATVIEAARLMRTTKCGCVLVTARSRVKGIVTSGDLVKRVTADGLDPMETKLAQVMTRNPDCVGCATLAIDALRMMQDGHYRHLPVVEAGKLVGIVSRRDFFGQEQDVVDEEDRLTEVMR